MLAKFCGLKRCIMYCQQCSNEIFPSTYNFSIKVVICLAINHWFLGKSSWLYRFWSCLVNEVFIWIMTLCWQRWVISAPGGVILTQSWAQVWVAVWRWCELSCRPWWQHMVRGEWVSLQECRDAWPHHVSRGTPHALMLYQPSFRQTAWGRRATSKSWSDISVLSSCRCWNVGR